MEFMQPFFNVPVLMLKIRSSKHNLSSARDGGLYLKSKSRKQAAKRR